MNRFIKRIHFQNMHMHLDKSHQINSKILKLSNQHMQNKWQLIENVKKNYTPKGLYKNMAKEILNQKNQGVTKIRSFIDVDSTIGLLAWNTAQSLKQRFNNDRFKIELGVQPLKGLANDQEFDLFKLASKDADFVGALPSRDGTEFFNLHMDRVFSVAHLYGLPVDAHLDQLNHPHEEETEKFVEFVEKWNYQGKSNAIHCVSLSKKDPYYIDRVSQRLYDNDIGVIVCPSAAISMMQYINVSANISNSIAPVNILINNGVRVALGTDNVHDIFMPLSDGDMNFEIRLLAEATRIYDIDILKKIAENYWKV